ncbi:MAG: hypothetical protein AAGF11_48585 [Myxococcota bacterium]
MSLWASVRDELRRSEWAGRLGRQIALGLVEAMRSALAGGRRVFICGAWPRVFHTLGLPRPCGKAARAALQLLAEVLPGAVVRVTSQTWRVVSHGFDRVVGEQLELAYSASKKKGESAQEPAQPARPARPRTPRARARASELERHWGREPAVQAARQLARAVEQLGAVESGTAWTVTLTVPDGADATATAEAFAERVQAAGAAVELVAERALKTGRLHYHGIAVVPDEVLDPDVLDGGGVLATWAHAAGVGSTDIHSIRDIHRLRCWASYCWKAPADDRPVIRVGALAPKTEEGETTAHPEVHAEQEPTEAAPASDRETTSQLRPGLLRRVASALRRVWRGWRT